MTSGDVLNAVGPESGVISDGDFTWPGDADLESVIPGLNMGDTNNASIIEFEFVYFIASKYRLPINLARMVFKNMSIESDGTTHYLRRRNIFKHFHKYIYYIAF